jgi:putative phosphoesterase
MNNGTMLGLLSDSHGRADATARAVRLLLDHGATMLIHLGDVGSVEVLDELVGHDARVVFGNCDHDEGRLARYAQSVGVVVDHPVGRLSLGGRSIVFTHGHLPHVLREAIAGGAAYVLHGHTHEPRDERIASTRIINPGALFRARRHTAALLDPARDALRFVEVSSSG